MDLKKLGQQIRSSRSVDSARGHKNLISAQIQAVADYLSSSPGVNAWKWQ